MFLLYKNETQFVDFPGADELCTRRLSRTHLVEFLSFFVEINFFPGYKGGEMQK